MALSGLPLAYLAVGGILVWSGVENTPVTDVLRSLSRGQAPAAGPYPPDTSGVGQAGITITGAGATATGQAIAQDALQYKGASYVWGGAPANGIGNWDCSSFCNWVIGHDMDMAIPGNPAGTYTGQSHGAVTGQWLIWGGCTTVGHSGSAAVAGDLCVWQTHMGIAIGGGQMISAQTPGPDQTLVSAIDGFIPELLFIRRLNAVVQPGSTGGVKR